MQHRTHYTAQTDLHPGSIYTILSSFITIVYYHSLLLWTKGTHTHTHPPLYPVPRSETQEDCIFITQWLSSGNFLVITTGCRNSCLNCPELDLVGCSTGTLLLSCTYQFHMHKSNTVCTFILLTQSLQLLSEASAWVHLYELRLPQDELSYQLHGLADSEDL